MSKSDKRPKAVSKEGKIGAVSCYVLDDGRCVLSLRGVVAALEGKGASDHGAGHAKLARYTDRLSSRVGQIAMGPVFEFDPPTGPPAQAVDDESFANLIDAYIDGLIMGKLHAQQIPIAMRARELQKAWAKIGLRAHIFAVTGHDTKKSFDEVRTYAERLFLATPREWSPTFPREFVEDVCGVYGWIFVGNRQPRQFASIYDKLYRMVLGDDGKAALKSRNPSPRHRSNHHQHLADEIARELTPLARAIAYIARRSGRSRDVFWREVARLLGDDDGQGSLPW